MVCEEESQAMRDAEENHGRASPEYRDASGEFFECLRNSISIIEGRHSHASAWDERMYLHWKFLEEAWEALLKGFKPVPPRCGKRSTDVRNQIFNRGFRISLH